jgi:hypothetical protein
MQLYNSGREDDEQKGTAVAWRVWMSGTEMSNNRIIPLSEK